MSRNRVAVLIASALAVGALAAVAVDELLDDDVSLTATPAGDVSAPADEAAGDVPAPVAEAPVGETPVGEAPAADSSAGAVSGEQAAAIGAAAAGGTAIDVWPGTEGGRSVFYVDVRTPDGLVEVYVDATTGDVLQIEPGD